MLAFVVFGTGGAFGVVLGVVFCGADFLGAALGFILEVTSGETLDEALGDGSSGSSDMSDSSDSASDSAVYAALPWGVLVRDTGSLVSCFPALFNIDALGSFLSTRG